VKKNIFYKNHIYGKSINSKLSKVFKKTIKNIKFNLNNSDDFFFSLSRDFKLNFNKKDLKKFSKYKNIILIGMGGSILGANAIYQFLQHKIKKKFVFFDNLDVENLKRTKIFQEKKTLYVVISKSGNTLETLSNLVSLKILKKNAKNIIIISEKNKNPLFQLSKKMNLFHVEHRKQLGGRYSVMSEVGALPAMLMGLNVDKFRSNLNFHLKEKNNKFIKEGSIKLADFLKTKKYNNIIFLNYSQKLNGFLNWYQQLLAESLGKEGKGFLPMISNNPKDHHSLLQLYLDGPRNNLFYIFSSEEDKTNKLNTKKFDIKLDFLKNKSLSQIKDVQKRALIQIFLKKKIPFREIHIKKFSEENLGELFSFCMLETAIIGNLANINPFNQPAVEQVKILSKKLLK
tara:strand:+ start:10424 stop:11623 length:1200 start_codon:yes stop_codon:yes gene_type:complete